jgi:multidrug efflux system membrane fusion protein
MNTAQIDSPSLKERSGHAATPAPVPVAPSPTPAPVPSAQTPHRKWWVYLILLVVAIGFGLFVWHELVTVKAAAADANRKRKAVHDLPVVSATVYRGDLNQYLIGLGTVTPLSTVTVKSRVDGEIKEIHFQEGDMVKQGDFLIQIDPRPYDAALKQAQGQLVKDKALLDSAEWTVNADTEAIKTHGITEQQLHIDTATRDQDKGAIEVDNANIETAQLNLTYAHITSPITGKIGLRLVDLGNIVHATDTTGLVVITQLQPITVIFNLPEDDLQQIQQEQLETGQPLAVDAYDRDLTKKLATGKLLAIDNEIDPTTGTVRIKAIFDNKDNALFPDQFVNARLLVGTLHNAVLVPAAAIQHSPTETFAYVVTPDPDGANGSTTAPSASIATTEPTSSQPNEMARAPGGGGANEGAAGQGKHPGGGKPIHGTVSMRQVTIGPTQAAVGTGGVDTTVVLSGLEPGEIVVTDGVDKLTDGSKVNTKKVPPPAKARSTDGPATMPTTMESSTTQPTGKWQGHHSGHRKAE